MPRQPPSQAKSASSARSASRARARSRAIAPAPPIDERRVVERPDGYHWIDEAARQEFGPFPSAARALEAMAGEGARGDEEVDALRIAEPDIDVEVVPRDVQGDDPPQGCA